MSTAIQAIPTASVAKICSGQVILDLSTAVKELVENALDAGATSIEVRLREHGLQLIEVADNGKGVPPEDHAALALKYHTSKISQFQDLEALHTFGFRGEALSSLAALGELSVITRTTDQAAATRLEFDRSGHLSSSSPVARAVGTTVAVKDLFAALPVRRQEFSRNVRREVAKLKLLLQQYAIMTGQAQLFASDQAGKSARTVLVSTSNAGSSLCERVSAVLGSKVAALLVPLEVTLEEEGVTITGLVSRAGCGVKGEKLRQFCCINGRPVELPRAIKTLNDTYKSLYSSLVGLRPMAFLSLELPAGTFDINVTPDKRSVFVQREVAIVNALGQALQALWEPSRCSFAVNTTQAAFDTQRPAPPAQHRPQPAAAGQYAEEDAEEDAGPGAGADAGAGAEEWQGRTPAAPSSAPAHQLDVDDVDGADLAGPGDTSGQSGQQQQQEEEEEGGRAAAAGSSKGPARGITRDGPPSLASFMIGAHPGAATAAAAAPSGRHDSQQQQQEGSAMGTPAAALGTPCVSSQDDTAAAAAATGQKRLRPLEAALLVGRKAQRSQHSNAAGPSAAAAAAAAAAAGGDATAAGVCLEVSPTERQGAAGSESEDESDAAVTSGAADSDADADADESEEADIDTDDQPASRAAAAAAAGPRARQQQQRGGAPPLLSSFGLMGSSSSSSQPATGGEHAAAAVADASTAAAADAAGEEPGRKLPSSNGGLHAGVPGGVRARGLGGDQTRQTSLAAFGFQMGSEGQRQLQQSSAATSGEQQSAISDDSQQQQQGSQLVVECIELIEQQEQQCEVDTAAGPAGEAELEMEAEAAGDDAVSEDDDVVIVDEQQQQQQQRGQSGRGAGSGEQQQQQQRPPVVVDYSMSQLLADVDLQMQQLRMQQQQQRYDVRGSTHLEAASLQGMAATDGPDPPSTSAAAAAAADGTGPPDAATSELMRVFNKASFAQMRAVGQFNLGFIIARLQGDLFIVDQHAADEKSTFERLMGSYSVNKQPMLQPRRLNTLTAMDQQTIRDHMDIFRRNGFDFVDSQPQPQQQQQQQHSRKTQHEQQQQQQRLWSKPPRSKAAAAAAAAAALQAPATDAGAAAGGVGTHAQQPAGGGADCGQQQGLPAQPAAAAAGDPGTAADAGGAASPAKAALPVPDLACNPCHGQQHDPGHDGCADDAGDGPAPELLLSAVPVLKGGASGGALGEEVLMELLDLIAAGETRPEDIRPKKVRDVLASRACRTSIMIGSPLTRQQQGRILTRLAQLDAPFNCPHGRPTMRHLAVLPSDQGQQHATGV